MNFLNTPAIEQSTYLIDVSFTDQNGAPVTPSTVSWSLCRDDGTYVNNRNAVAITPASTVTVVLSGVDLALDAPADSQMRVLVVTAVANTTYGVALPFVSETSFQIQHVIGC